MNTDTGEIATMEEWARRGVDQAFIAPLEYENTNLKRAEPGTPYAKPLLMENLSPRVRRMVESTGKGWVSRNSKCPCGSGRRFKRCCMTGKDGQ